MELLIDTHTVFWFITEDKKLPTNTKRIIEDVDNKGFSVQEI